MQFDLFIKKIGQRKFLASASSHEIQCEHHLVAVLFVCGKFVLMWTICQRLKFLLSHFVFARSLRSACSFGLFEAAQAKEVGEAGEKTSAFEMVSPPRKRLYYR